MCYMAVTTERKIYIIREGELQNHGKNQFGREAREEKIKNDFESSLGGSERDIH